MIAALGLAIALSNDLVLEGTDVQLYDRGYVVTGPNFTRVVIDGEVKEYDREMSGGVMSFPEIHIDKGRVYQEPYSGKIFQTTGYQHAFVNREFAARLYEIDENSETAHVGISITRFSDNKKFEIEMPVLGLNVSLARHHNVPYMLIAIYETRESYSLWKFDASGKLERVPHKIGTDIPQLQRLNSDGYVFATGVAPDSYMWTFNRYNTILVHQTGIGKAFALDPLGTPIRFESLTVGKGNPVPEQRFRDGRYLFHAIWMRGSTDDSLQMDYYIYENGKYIPLAEILPGKPGTNITILDSHQDGRIAYFRWNPEDPGKWRSIRKIHVTNIMKKP
ncbi:MAG: hypothetical protein R2688_01850 [Fimbriimonadaceae bacterium]